MQTLRKLMIIPSERAFI